MKLPRTRTRTLLLSSALLLSACTPIQATEWAAVNNTRGWFGRPALAESPAATSIAQAYADLLSAGAPFRHNPNLASQLDASGEDWLAAGENVGCGATQLSVFTAYIGSTTHRHNILSRAWDAVGVGVSTVGGTTCTVHVFVDRG